MSIRRLVSCTWVIFVFAFFIVGFVVVVVLLLFLSSSIFYSISCPCDCKSVS